MLPVPQHFPHAQSKVQMRFPRERELILLQATEA